MPGYGVFDRECSCAKMFSLAKGEFTLRFYSTLLGYKTLLECIYWSATIKLEGKKIVISVLLSWSVFIFLYFFPPISMRVTSVIVKKQNFRVIPRRRDYNVLAFKFVQQSWNARFDQTKNVGVSSRPVVSKRATTLYYYYIVEQRTSWTRRSETVST